MASPSSDTPATTAARRRVFETVLREQSLHMKVLLRTHFACMQDNEMAQKEVKDWLQSLGMITGKQDITCGKRARNSTSRVWDSTQVNIL